MNESGSHVTVQADGSVNLPASELRRAGIAPGMELTLAPTPDGLALASPDTYPRKAYVELTTDCNLNCAMCLRDSWEAEGGTMSPETFGRIIEQLKAMPGERTINLSGYGEPMTHPLFHDFLPEAKAAGLGVEVVTNGTLFGPAACERLTDGRLDKLIVSIDGVSPAASERLHAGSLAAARENLRALHHLKLAQRLDLPEVVIEFVATRRNIHELPELKRCAHLLGVSSIIVTNLIPHTPELAEDILYKRWSTTSRTRGGASPWAPAIDLPLMDPGAPADDVVQRLRNVGAYLRTTGVDAAGAGPRCRFVTEGRFAIAWDGAISPCLSLMHTHTHYFRDKPKRIRRYTLGNVSETALATIWTSREYRAFRDRVRRFEFSPCIDCGGCDLRNDNEQDCSGDTFPRCGECLWAAGLIQCP